MEPASAESLTADQIRIAVEEEIKATPAIDVHTHLFMPSLGAVGLWGIDDLVTYHYLEAEFFRSSPMTPAEYWGLAKRERADAIWRALFVENAPVSEATRGVVAVLQAFGLATGKADLTEAREFFAAQDYPSHIRRVLEIAGVSEVVMTNDPLDPDEAPLWESGAERHSQFHAVLRLDRILNKWAEHRPLLQAKGYRVEGESSEALPEVRRYLAAWCQIMHPVYMAVSLPDTFQYPEDSVRNRLLTESILPLCRELDLPMALMIGVRYQVNPALRAAGDGSGKADLRSIERLCAKFPGNRFLVSVLSRENQHELCVYARKFSNLMPFGCWWFLNNPSVVEEITRERLEMLGTTFIPQHSDARILEQVIYKWRNTRRTLAPILAHSFQLLAEDGRAVTRAEIHRDVKRLLRTNFQSWARLPGDG
ncbi:MAG: glucuronate isomerase [Bryobacteraceae bacterium]|jgi:hypothetical protein